MRTPRAKFPSREIPHIWAHQTAEEGHGDAKIGFEGASLYSYLTEIGRIVRNKKGQTAYLLNEKSYSPTTNKHQSWMHSAIPANATVFMASGELRYLTGKQLLAHALESAARCANLAETARSHKDYHLADQANRLESAKQIIEFYGLQNKIDEKTIDRLRAVQKRAKAAKEKALAEQQKRLEAANAETFAAWLRGELVSFPSTVIRVFVRVSPHDENNMETSRGVFVPLKEARRVFRFAQRHRTPEGWRRNGERFGVGDYQLDSITDAGIVAGCHHIQWDEIERFAKLMGWMK